jgi:hypothetical protein
VVFDVSADSAVDDLGISENANYWRIAVYNADETDIFFGACHSTTTLLVSDSIDLAIDEYWFINTEGSTAIGCAAANAGGTPLEEGAPAFSITGIASPAAALAAIAMPSSTGSDALGFVGGQLSDPGIYLILILVIGLPLIFSLLTKSKLTPKK